MVCRAAPLCALGATILFHSMLSFNLAEVYLRREKDNVPHSRDNDLPRVGSERTALESVMRRAEWSRSRCAAAVAENRVLEHNSTESSGGSSLPMLPAAGVADSIRKWMRSPSGSTSRPACEMPPSKSCGAVNATTTFTVVIMSYNTDRFPKLMNALKLVFPAYLEVGLTEIIFVWNAPRSVLERASMDEEGNCWIATGGRRNRKLETTNKKGVMRCRIAANMLRWDADPTHPFRIFYALEHGLTNNLLNRYHPSIAPANEAVVMFDDDGPFFTMSDVAMRTGIELWKRNSDVQVGVYGRRVAFSGKMTKDRATRQLILGDTKTYSNFDPFCPGDVDDRVEYKRGNFSDFDSLVILPTGSIMHRKYLCFVWHPALEGLRRFVSDHATHPDDMVVSVLIAQLSGRGAKLYPRELDRREQTSGRGANAKLNKWLGLTSKQRPKKKKKKNSKILPHPSYEPTTSSPLDEPAASSSFHEPTASATLDPREPGGRDVRPPRKEHSGDAKLHARKLHGRGAKPNEMSGRGDGLHPSQKSVRSDGDAPDADRRRLMWERSNWFEHRTDAINSILGYFGTVHPGSVGWCSDTSHMKKGYRSTSSAPFVCEPHLPSTEMIPWMNEHDSGYHRCPQSK